MKQTQGNKSTLNDKLLKYFLKKEAKCCRIDKINRLKNSDLLILLTNAIEPICTTTSRKRPPIRKNKKLGVSPMKVVRLGRTIAFYQVFFQQGSVALGKCYIGLQNGHAPQDSRDGFFLYSARLLRRACSRSFWIVSFEFFKICGIRFSIWESFIGFYICCYPISTILACLFSVGVRISWKKLCWKGAWRRRWHLVSPTLYIIIVYTVNLNKLSRNFVGALRTTTTNWRVSFIYLYLVFPRNFKIVFLPHTNTLNLLEPYCGIITEPGTPVIYSLPPDIT